ncbi:hypothetical protein F25303_7550 [Fusarium sp. NRRL 25303]|nr:hypothetical protein F25303_7550 [Fusarium sp. NRRL 25303]
MSSTSAIIPAWEQKIRDNAAVSVPSHGMISMNSLHTFGTAQFEPSMYKEHYPVPDNVKNQLIGIHIVSVQDSQTAAKICIDTIQGLKNTRPDKNVWDGIMTNARETAKQSFSNRFDNASHEAINIINDLPPVQQDGAANFFSHGMGIVSRVINEVSYRLADVDTKDLLEGKWNKLAEVDVNIMAGCSAAIDALNSMF